MSSNSNYFLKKTLGEDFFESLAKFEIWKPGTKTVIDHEEIKTALQIVPRVMMALLVRELTAMAIGDTKEVHIPVPTVPASMMVTKHENDVYSGEIHHENKKITEFKYRSIPGVGLIIMSTFELYSQDDLTSGHEPVDTDIEEKVQKLVEERMALHELINKVVDKKLMQKEAVQTLILSKLSDAINTGHGEPTMNKKESTPQPVKKGSPLKSFLESRKKKDEFSIEMAKGETVNCPDCDKNIFDGKLFSGCICLGDDMEKKVFIKKTEDGIKVRFSKGWDQENIEMLLEVLRRKNG